MAAVDKQALGRQGEELACRYFVNQGYSIIETNWRCRVGELDIIALHKAEVVFIEVRVKKNNSRYGSAVASVDLRKQQQLRRTALQYLHFRGWHERSVRFDVIAFTYQSADDMDWSFEHICSAF